jgi:NAD(P)-dependent dehydrogenase (short-subunit alcohol dehydrogenase family)
MADRFNSRVVLVAGGTGGLGRAVALAFLNESATVFVTYRNEDEYAALQKASGQSSSRLRGHRVDATNEVDASRLVEEIVTTSRRIDVMVNSIGAYAGGSPLWQTPPDVFDRMFSLNVRSGYVLSRAVVPVMLKQGAGSIVNVSSRAAFDHAAGAAAYAASKAAALAMIDALAADLKGTGVRANTVLPSIIDTPANRTAMPGADFGSWPKPEDIARVILFLCSDEAKLIHGAAVPVYGAA